MLTVMALAAATPLAAKPVCAANTLGPIATGGSVRAHPLTAEPPARQVYTVLRTEDGCARPVPVNDRVVGAPRR